MLCTRNALVLMSAVLALNWAGMALADMQSLWATEHRDQPSGVSDDLVTAGLGLSGLQAERSALIDETLSEPALLRRLAFHGAWNGLSALHHKNGLGPFGNTDLPRVQGREWHQFRWLPNAQQPSRVLLQKPDHFDPERPCLVATASSGSRGIYGAVPLVAPWALPKGCAVAYTDKGAGTDFFDYSDHTGVSLSGRRVAADSAPLGFTPPPANDLNGATIAMPHAHSGDHPESRWGEHVIDAIEWALQQLTITTEHPITADTTRIIATGLSNGANAVLRAAERIPDSDMIDAVVAVMPNITPPDTPHLFEYALTAALYQPCMLADTTLTADWPMMNPMLAALGQLRCQSLADAGRLEAAAPQLALQALLDQGFDEDALWLSVPIVALDLWRSVVVNYASAYLKRGPFDMPCGYAIEAPSATPQQRQQWWATHPGGAPGDGIVINDGLATGSDPMLPGLLCLADLLADQGDDGAALRAAIDATRATAHPGPNRPVILVHGSADSLIPAALSSRPYAALATDTHPNLRTVEVDKAQHFDAFMAALDDRYGVQAILPHGWIALDQVWAELDQ
jgi:hydroxybutyrate-dimer hydrolase